MPVESESKSAGRTSVWPEVVPELLTIALPDRLRVPIGVRALGKRASNQRGRGSDAGSRWSDHAAESSHVPLAPADGVLGEIRPIRLTTGGPATAVELIVSGEGSPENPEIHSSAGD